MATQQSTQKIKKGSNFRTLDVYEWFKGNLRISKLVILISNNVSMVEIYLK